MSATHTPGPWYAIEYAGMWGIQSVNEYSQDNNLLDMENDDRAEANAKLIAAAPEMLQSLQECVKYLSSLESLDGSNMPFEWDDDFIGNLKKTIKKATE